MIASNSIPKSSGQAIDSKKYKKWIKNLQLSQETPIQNSKFLLPQIFMTIPFSQTDAKSNCIGLKTFTVSTF